jgi:hypothetical protein
MGAHTAFLDVMAKSRLRLDHSQAAELRFRTQWLQSPPEIACKWSKHILDVVSVCGCESAVHGGIHEHMRGFKHETRNPKPETRNPKLPGGSQRVSRVFLGVNPGVSSQGVFMTVSRPMAGLYDVITSHGVCI